MSKENIQYIYEAEEFNENLGANESYSGPVLMGREREYFQGRHQAVQEFIIQNTADLEAQQKKPIDTRGQLFGISNQNKSSRVSLDEKFPGEMIYQLKVDNMAPFYTKNSYVMLKFCEQHASGEICVFRYQGKTYCNQIKVINKKVIAFSFNEKYKPVVLNPDQYFFIAVVNSLHTSSKEVIHAYEYSLQQKSSRNL